MEKIKTNHLLVSGHSWTSNKEWYKVIYDANRVTNLSYPGAGNKYISESIIESIITDDTISNVLVCWSGLLRVDIALPKIVKPSWYHIEQKGETLTSRYYTNDMAPWRDRNVKIPINTELVRLMYQEKEYTSVKNQSLLQIINLQSFLKVKKIDYKFCFMYDYTNQDFDHNHLTGQSPTGHFSTLGSVDANNPILNELDRSMVLSPAGIDWALTQDTDFFVDPIHLTENGLRDWATVLLKSYR